MRKIFISAGHSNKAGRDNGASSGRLIEGQLAQLTREVLVAAIVKLGGTAVVDDPSLITIETVKAWKSKIGPNDIAIDLHFNAAANTDIDGVECIVPEKPNKLELEIADKISNIVSEVLKTPERGKIGIYDGVKYESQTARKQLAWMTLPGNTVLVEWQFITDKVAMDTFIKNFPLIANRVAVYLTQLQNTN